MIRQQFWFSLVFVCSTAFAGDWPQGAGAGGDFATSEKAPIKWSVVQDKNILWRKTLPETGQSTVVTHGDLAFFTTMEPVTKDSQLGQNIDAWCVNKNDGKTVWKLPIAGRHPLRLSGCFSDSTSPPPVTDGNLVVFVNASGTITAFNLAGKQVWTRDLLTVGRTQPFLHDGNLVFIRQIYTPVDGKFGHNHKNAPLSEWTQLVGIDFKTGKDKWASVCGVNMGCVPLPQKTPEGKSVAIVGRGGGHSPPEKPEGVSMVDLSSGETIWSLDLKGFMSTQTFPVKDGKALVFYGPNHLEIDVATGEIVREIPITGKVTLCDRANTAAETELKSAGKRNITQQSNLLVGDYHYFRCYTKNWLGRVNLKAGKVEYLELPLQLVRGADGSESLLYPPAVPETYLDKKGRKKKKPFNQITHAANDMKNSRGFVVVGDNRSTFNGWGHYSSAVPTLAGKHLYVPTMAGTVFVIDAFAESFNTKAVAAINDLGPIGGSWNRASLSVSDGKIYAHTIKEVICIGK